MPVLVPVLVACVLVCLCVPCPYLCELHCCQDIFMAGGIVRGRHTGQVTLTAAGGGGTRERSPSQLQEEGDTGQVTLTAAGRGGHRRGQPHSCREGGKYAAGT